MAEEPQPSTVHEGMEPGTSTSEQPEAPKGGDSQKAAAALSSLDARSTAAEESARKPPSAADQKALGEAMSRLELLDAGSKVGSTADGGKAGAAGGKDGAEKVLSPAAKKRAEEREQREKEVEERRKVKVDPADVALLVEHCEISKPRATELLKAARGDAVRALSEWVKAAA